MHLDRQIRRHILRIRPTALLPERYSDDFLKEAKYASREKTSGRIELVFLIPAENRIPELEAVIRKRLHEHFRKHANILEKEVRDIRLQGTRMSLCGFILLAASSYIIWKSQQSYWSSLLRVLTEPSGWFLSWERPEPRCFLIQGKNRRP